MKKLILFSIFFIVFCPQVFAVVPTSNYYFEGVNTFDGPSDLISAGNVWGTFHYVYDSDIPDEWGIMPGLDLNINFENGFSISAKGSDYFTLVETTPTSFSFIDEEPISGGANGSIFVDELFFDADWSQGTGEGSFSFHPRIYSGGEFIGQYDVEGRIYNFVPNSAPVPEPASLLLFGLGLAGLFIRRVK